MLKAEARRLARIIRAAPGVTNAQRSQLGLTVPDKIPTPAARPSDPPVLSIVPSIGRTVRIRLRDKREKFVAGVTIADPVQDVALRR